MIDQSSPVTTAIPVDLDLRSSKAGEPTRKHKSWLGLSAEYVRIAGPMTYDFRVKRSSSYVALHEFKRMDGETFIDGTRRSELKDLRNKITVVPCDCGVNGWTRIADDAYFTAVYFDGPTDEGAPGGPAQHLSQIAPMLLFENELVRVSLLKFQAILNGTAPDESIYAETLGLLLSLELSRIGHRKPTQPSPARGGLTRRQIRQVIDYMEANLQNDINLGDLAGLLNLSRFHFVRTFKQSTGLPPHRFLMARRIERAKELLAEPGMSITEVSRRAGFHGVTQLTRSFRRLTGTTPSGFRRDRF
jgi:AraC family transcriptional regulator